MSIFVFVLGYRYRYHRYSAMCNDFETVITLKPRIQKLRQTYLCRETTCELCRFPIVLEFCFAFVLYFVLNTPPSAEGKEELFGTMSAGVFSLLTIL